jgi:hypothetical protein
MSVVVAAFVGIVLTGTALVAPGAHLYEMSHKLTLTEEQYYLVQGNYEGWWIAGLLLPAAFLANGALAVLAWSDILTRALALGATALIGINLVIFFMWTNPVNATTGNWTVRTPAWQALRLQWEYSHAVNAGVTFLAFCLVAAAGLAASAKSQVRDRARS